jgi:hypothetical protein
MAETKNQEAHSLQHTTHIIRRLADCRRAAKYQRQQDAQHLRRQTKKGQLCALCFVLCLVFALSSD